MNRRAYFIASFSVLLAPFALSQQPPRPAQQQGSTPPRAPAGEPRGPNFPDRRGYAINNSPFLELSDFRFENKHQNYSTRLITELRWKNIGDKPIIAFEIVVVYFDPFNERIRTAGGVWLVTGRDSADWRALPPGGASSDGLIGHRQHPVLTAFAYVRAVRHADGTVWRFDLNVVEEEIRRRLPDIREIGNLDPDPEPGPQPQR
jgi:hypothetical protein